MNTGKITKLLGKLPLQNVRHLVMPRIKWHHYLLIAGVFIPNIAVVYIIESPLPAITIGVWLFIPCKDRQFGNGKKYYWIRQTIFGLGTIMCVWAGVA